MDNIVKTVTETAKTLVIEDEWALREVSPAVDIVSIVSKRSFVLDPKNSKNVIQRILSGGWFRAIVFHGLCFFVFELTKINDSKSRCYPYNEASRYKFLLPLVYLLFVLVYMWLTKKTSKFLSLDNFRYLYAINDEAISFYGPSVTKCAVVLFLWMAYSALTYFALTIGVACNSTQQRRNWAGVRWGLFYATHFWYVATILFWAFCSVNVHTYPPEMEETLKQQREEIKRDNARYVDFFERVLRVMDDDSKTDGTMYVVLILSAILTLLTIGVSIATQLRDTKAELGFWIWGSATLVILACPTISVIAWMAWSTYNHMTCCQAGLFLFESRVSWRKLTDILAFESMREHIVQNELPFRLCHPLYHASWFISLSFVLCVVYVVMLVQNFTQFSTQPGYVAIKLARNILALLVVMFALLYFRTFSDLHAKHDENHRKLLRKSIVELQVLKLKYDSQIESTSVNNEEVKKTEQEPEAKMDGLPTPQMSDVDSPGDSSASPNKSKEDESPEEKRDECEGMIDVLEKMQEFQEGLDPLYVVRVFGFPVVATPALVDTITGTIGAYVAVVFSLFLNQLTA